VEAKTNRTRKPTDRISNVSQTNAEQKVSETQVVLVSETILVLFSNDTNLVIMPPIKGIILDVMTWSMIDGKKEVIKFKCRKDNGRLA
jgi:hypothetical protein